MTIRFLLLVNKQGQTRLATYNEIVPLEERRQIEGEIVRKCLTRSEMQCSFLEHRGLKVIYRRYASLYFVVGVDDQENELAIYEFIHCVVETLDRHFGNVCELDIMFHLEKAHYTRRDDDERRHPGDEQIHRPSDRHPVRGGESDVAARNDETSARRGGETWYRRGTRRATVA